MMVKEKKRLVVHRPSGITIISLYLAHSIICQFDVSVVVQEHIVQLQVTVDYSLLMQKVQSYADFRRIKSEEQKSSICRQSKKMVAGGLSA